MSITPHSRCKSFTAQQLQRKGRRRALFASSSSLTEMSRWLYYSSYFLPRGLPCPASRRLTSPSPPPPPPESALSLSPSFQVIDVLSLRRIHQHGGGILGRSEEASQEGLANNSALSSSLVLQMFCRPLPPLLPSGLWSHLQIWRGPRPTWFP